MKAMLAKRKPIIVILVSVVIAGVALLLWSTRLSHLAGLPEIDKSELEAEPEQSIFATQKGLFLTEGDVTTELAAFDQLVELKFPDLVAVENNEVWYWQVKDTGEIVKSKNLGNLPDLILAMHVQIIQVGDKVYLAYVIPLRGLRVVNIASKENYLVMDATFFRMFTGNQLVVREQSVFVPNGEVPSGISLWEVNLETRVGSYTGISTLPCGEGDWQVRANVGAKFVLSLGARVCLLDIWTGVASIVEGKWIQQFVGFSEGGELLALEEFEIINELPVSTGRVAIYDVETRELVTEADLSAEPLVQELRDAQGGSLRLSGQVQKVGEEVRLVSLGTERVLRTKLKVDMYEVTPLQ